MTEAYDHDGVMVNSGPFDGVRSRVDRAGHGLARGAGRGRPAVTYRLRDWLISRQRYWGLIPIVHCPEHGEVAVPDDQLPVLLPDDVDFRPGGESPLARHQGFVNTVCPICGSRPSATPTRWTRSSIPLGTTTATARRRRRRGRSTRPKSIGGCPSTSTSEGVEHAILHLLYCRFFTKVLFDMGMVGFTEPMLR